MVGTSKIDKTEKVGITLPSSLLRRMENVRGDIPRSTLIRRALEQYLRKEGKWLQRPILRGAIFFRGYIEWQISISEQCHGSIWIRNWCWGKDKPKDLRMEIGNGKGLF